MYRDGGGANKCLTQMKQHKMILSPLCLVKGHIKKCYITVVHWTFLYGLKKIRQRNLLEHREELLSMLQWFKADSVRAGDAVRGVSQYC